MKFIGKASEILRICWTADSPSRQIWYSTPSLNTTSTGDKKQASHVDVVKKTCHVRKSILYVNYLRPPHGVPWFPLNVCELFLLPWWWPDIVRNCSKYKIRDTSIKRFSGRTLVLKLYRFNIHKTNLSNNDSDRLV